MSSCNKTKETGVLYNLIVLRRNIHRPGDGRIAVRSKRARVIEDVGDNVGMSTIMDHVSAAADWDYEVAHVVVEKWLQISLAFLVRILGAFIPWTSCLLFPRNFISDPLLKKVCGSVPL